MTFVVPGAVLKQVKNCGSGITKPTLGLILHVQAGNNSPYGWFNNTAAQASSTWWVSKTGVIEQYIDPDTEHAWAQADGNRDYHSVETEGFPSEPLTHEQLAALGKIYHEGHTRWGWPLQLAEKPGDKGLGWHGMGGLAWGGHIACPGELRKAQRSIVLTLANPDPVVPKTAPAPAKAPAPTKPAYPGVMRQGASGSFVKLIQKVIGTSIDGQWGPNTTAKFEAWQRRMGLTADGVFGPASYKKMFG